MNGGTGVYVVLTLPKRAASNLAYQYERLNEVHKRFRRKMRTLGIRFPVEAVLKGVEETYSDQSAWHVHLNLIWLFQRQLSAAEHKEFEQLIVRTWLQAATQHGIGGTSATAQKVTPLRDPASGMRTAAYITKYSYYPLELPRAAADGSYRGLNPWMILELARHSPGCWKSIWNQFERATKGLRRFTVLHHDDRTVQF